MLAVVSAVVAFDRWPGAAVAGRTQTLILTDKPAAIRVGTHAVGPSATPGARRVAAALPGARTRGVTAPTNAGGTLGLVRRNSGGTQPAPATPQGPQLPKAPAVPSPQQIPDLISNPGTTAGQVADAGQSATDAAGVAVGRTSPDLGTAVTGVGQVAASTVRELPLPGHIIPGH